MVSRGRTMIAEESPKNHGLAVLRADAVLRIVGRDVEIAIDDAVYCVSGPDPVALANALSLLNGVLELDQVSAKSGLPLPVLQHALDELVTAGALEPPSGASWEPIELASRCRALYGPWKTRLFSHPLWMGLVDGSLPHTVFVGWAVESYWFIEGVLDRLPMAIACCESRGVRAVFSRHFAEEWDHFQFFARTLDALGVTAEQRAHGRPLPATRAVQDWMRAAARRDPLRYAACSGFLESTGNDRSVARSFFGQVAKHYDAERTAVEPMAEHVDLDEGYGHSSFVEKVVREIEVVDPARAHAALQAAYGLVETLEMWSTDILTHYRSPNSLPLSSVRCYRDAE